MTWLSGRVLRSQSGQHWVLTEQGVIHCSLRGRLKKEKKARTDLVVIGDRVQVTLLPDAEGEGVIEAVEERDNRFARRQPGGRGRYKEHVMVANLDWLALVFACASPPPNPRLLDRFLVVAELDGLDAVIVANKIDQVERDRAEEVFAPYAALGYPVTYTSALTGEGIEPLRERLRGGVSAFVGPSGVGKSSLLNALEPGLGKAIGAISDTLDKGRHTTRVAELHPLEGGGWVADTPGIRELASFELPARELPACFPEMRPFLGACRFPDCAHVHEPGCAVREALERGEIDPARYDSYRRILAGDER
ncbi:MAG: ribosome small subunit-dependent GTPase A [Myxococcota bacterium]|nr:ribosome small subunit-dependent GTPase A [Myxococcota bacterium]